MMKKICIVVLLTFLTVFTVVSVGYARWQKTLVIKGNITVNKPEIVDPLINGMSMNETVTDSVYQKAIPVFTEPAQEDNSNSDAGNKPDADIHSSEQTGSVSKS